MNEKVSDVMIMGDLNAKIGLGAEEQPNSYEKRLLKLVRAGDLKRGDWT